MSETKDCTTCKEALFCPTWGEYRCLTRKTNIVDPKEGVYCGLYSKGVPSSDCHCETCEEKVDEDV